MGHPYNQTQKIEIKDLSRQRFVGTEIQKNLFYGRDIPVLRYEYTFKQKHVEYDVSSYKYDFLTSGDFVQLYLDGYDLRATPKYLIQGEAIDYPSLSATWSGLEQTVQKDHPLIAPQPSGYHDPIDLDRPEKRFLYKESYVVRIDYDRPAIKGTITASGNLMGIRQNAETAGMFFYTGSYHGNNYIPPHVPVLRTTAATGQANAKFFFHVGTYDGPQT